VATSGNALVRFNSDGFADTGRDVGFTIYFVSGSSTGMHYNEPLKVNVNARLILSFFLTNVYVFRQKQFNLLV